MVAIDLVNQVSLFVGVILLIAFVVRASRGTGLIAAVQVPPSRIDGLAGLDAALVAWLFLFLPTVVMSVVGMLDLSMLMGSMEGERRSSVVMALSMAAAGSLNIVAVLYIGRSKIQGGFEAWGLKGSGFTRRIWQAFLIVMMICPVLFGLMYLVVLLYTVATGNELPEHAALLTLREASTPIWLIVVTCMNAVVIAPVLEELVIRGILLPVLTKHLRSSWRAIVISALLFGMIHINVPQTIPSLTLFGMILGYAYLKSGSLVLPIVIHALFNLRTVVFTLLGAGEI